MLFLSFRSRQQSGGFYSAEDADSVPTAGGSEKREGAFCVWTASEVRELLPDVVAGTAGSATLADIFMHHYGVKEQGNVTPEQVIYDAVICIYTLFVSCKPAELHSER